MSKVFGGHYTWRDTQCQLTEKRCRGEIEMESSAGNSTGKSFLRNYRAKCSPKSRFVHGPLGRDAFPCSWLGKVCGFGIGYGVVPARVTVHSTSVSTVGGSVEGKLGIVR